MNLEKVDLQEIVESAVNSIQKQVSKKHHRIILEDFSPQETWLVYNPWTDQETKVTINTFAIVTTEANTLMKQIHNSKERMPTILPGDLAESWLYKDLTDQDILDIANYQVATAEMKATPLHKDFLKRQNPHEEVVYQEVPHLIYTA